MSLEPEDHPSILFLDWTTAILFAGLLLLGWAAFGLPLRESLGFAALVMVVAEAVLLLPFLALYGLLVLLVVLAVPVALVFAGAVVAWDLWQDWRRGR